MRSRSQRHHDGLPATLIVSVSLGELCALAGVARTAVGTLLSIPDVIRLAGHAEHYLRIFDEHTAEELHLGRSRRLASRAQRLASPVTVAVPSRVARSRPRIVKRIMAVLIGRRMVGPTSTNSPWPAARTTNLPTTGAGKPALVPTAASTGARHHYWTSDKTPANRDRSQSGEWWQTHRGVCKA